MGRVRTEATIENYLDLLALESARSTMAKVRRVVVTDALADSGAKLLCLPRCLIQRLGLSPYTTRRAATAAGAVDHVLYGAVRLTVQGRVCLVDAQEVPDLMPVTIGQIPLLHLDLVINPNSRALTGNPAHGGEHMSELY